MHARFATAAAGQASGATTAADAEKDAAAPPGPPLEACTGISKEEIEIQIQDNILKVNYDKSKNENLDYIHKGIAKRSFNLGWKIDSKFDLGKANAKFENGLLAINIPFAKGSELKTLKIS